MELEDVGSYSRAQRYGFKARILGRAQVRRSKADLRGTPFEAILELRLTKCEREVVSVVCSS